MCEEAKTKHDTEYCARKQEHISRDWDAAWRMNEQLFGQAEAWRRWNLAVVLAYLGIVATPTRDWTGVCFWIIWVPLALTIIVFYILESNVRAQTYFFDAHIKQIECLFTMRSEEEFLNAVCGHKFLCDCRETCKRKDSWPRAWKALWNPWVCAWYVGQLVVTLVVVYWVLDRC